MVLAIGVVCVLLVFTGVASGFLVTIVGFLYPSYMSFKALESSTKADDKFLLTYWVIFAFFRVFDGLFGFLLHLIPFYDLLKLVFLVYLYYPRTRGATVVYDKFIA